MLHVHARGAIKWGGIGGGWVFLFAHACFLPLAASLLATCASCSVFCAMELGEERDSLQSIARFSSLNMLHTLLHKETSCEDMLLGQLPCSEKQPSLVLNQLSFCLVKGTSHTNNTRKRMSTIWRDKPPWLVTQILVIMVMSLQVTSYDSFFL